MVRPVHPRRLTRITPSVCVNTESVYRIEADGEPCPDYLDTQDGCCTFDVNTRDDRDIRFLHLVREIFYNAPSQIFLRARPISADFVGWINDIPHSLFSEMTRPSVSINDERFDLIRAFILQMHPGKTFKLRVTVPAGHHVFRFTDNFGGRTTYTGLGTGTSTLDVSNAGYQILEKYADIPVMHHRASHGFEIRTRNLIPIIRRDYTLAHVLTGFVRAFVHGANPEAYSQVLFVRGNAGHHGIPHTHKHLHCLESSLQAVEEANSLVSHLQHMSLHEVFVQEESGKILVTATANVTLRHKHPELKVTIWPNIRIEMFPPIFETYLP